MRLRVYWRRLCFVAPFRAARLRELRHERALRQLGALFQTLNRQVTELENKIDMLGARLPFYHPDDT